MYACVTSVALQCVIRTSCTRWALLIAAMHSLNKQLRKPGAVWWEVPCTLQGQQQAFQLHITPQVLLLWDLLQLVKVNCELVTGPVFQVELTDFSAISLWILLSLFQPRSTCHRTLALFVVVADGNLFVGELCALFDFLYELPHPARRPKQPGRFRT